MDKLDEFARQRIERDLHDLKELIESHFVERKKVWRYTIKRLENAHAFNMVLYINTMVT